MSWLRELLLHVCDESCGSMGSAVGPITIWSCPFVPLFSDTQVVSPPLASAAMVQKRLLSGSERPSPLTVFIVRVTNPFWYRALAAVMSAAGASTRVTPSLFVVSPVGSETTTLERGGSAAAAVGELVRGAAMSAASAARTTAGRRKREQ